MRDLVLGVITASVLFGVSACGGGADDDCSVETEKAHIQWHMENLYLWFDQVPDVNLADFDTGEALLDQLMYRELDRWSYLADITEFDAWVEGYFTGIGVQTMFNDVLGEIRLTYIYPGSPAEAAGLLRGDYLLQVNGYGVNELLTADGWAQAWGDGAAGVPAELQVQTPGAEPRMLTVTRAEFAVETTPYVEIIDRAAARIGYLMFTSFITPGQAALNEAFATLREAGVTELVLDLRYNGGGLVNIAAWLGSLVGGERTNGEIFSSLVYNANMTDLNRDYRFSDPAEALDLSRVVVLTTDSTCSASEAVINGLSPFVEVITVGSTTCGKPVGMLPDDDPALCGKILSAVNFQNLNASGEGDYFAGIAPTCPADDDLATQLSDPAEGMLAEAIHYLENQSCSVVVSASAARSRGVWKNRYEGFHREAGIY